MGILRPVLNVKDVGIFLFSKDGTILAMNRLCEDVFNIPKNLINL